jgi:hypothetical protein
MSRLLGRLRANEQSAARRELGAHARSPRAECEYAPLPDWIYLSLWNNRLCNSSLLREPRRARQPTDAVPLEQGRAQRAVLGRMPAAPRTLRPRSRTVGHCARETALAAAATPPRPDPAEPAVLSETAHRRRARRRPAYSQQRAQPADCSQPHAALLAPRSAPAHTRALQASRPATLARGDQSHRPAAPPTLAIPARV